LLDCPDSKILLAAMRPRAILKHHSNSYPFEERNLDLSALVKVGRAVAKCKPQGDNAIFDCKVLSRSHAVIWFENDKVSPLNKLPSCLQAAQNTDPPILSKLKFFIKDTCSSNGTFINNNRLSPANEDSPVKEIHSNDIIQFGVEVVDNTSKITHGCIILRIKLFYPNGLEASRPATMLNIPTTNMLPPYYSYTQMLEREQQIYQKLSSIEDLLEEAHLLADMTIHAKNKEEQLAKQIDELQTTCDEKTKYAQRLEIELKSLEDNIKKHEMRQQEDAKLIRSLESKVVQRELKMEQLQRQLERQIRHDHRLVTTLFLLLLIVLVVGGFDMLVMFMRLIGN